MRLELKLVYTNVGKGPLILLRGSPTVSQLMVSRSMSDATANRFEVNSSLTPITGGGQDCYSSTRVNKCFVVLAPGEAYEAQVVTGTFAVKEDAKEIAGAVKSGSHVLQVKVLTWQESAELAREVRSRWLKYGSLWYQPVVSAPTRFDVASQRKLTDCR